MFGKPHNHITNNGLPAWNKDKKLLKQTGELHFAWKGEGVSYRNLHRWVERNMGKASNCTHCGLDRIPEGKTRYFQWANKSHGYKRILEDWMSLCYKCHIAYDKAHREVNA